MIYLVTIILLLLLSIHYDINGRSKGKMLWYRILMVELILLAGLRWRIGFDTTAYIAIFYYDTPDVWDLSSEDLNIGNKPLWLLINSLVHSCGGRFFVVQLIHASIFNILYFKYVKRHSQYIFTCIFFYFIWTFYNQNMEEMKGSLAIVISLFGNDYILEKKWLKGFSLYLVSCLFHFQAFFLIIIPMTLFLRFNKKGICVLIFSFLIGGIIQATMGDYLMLFEFNEQISDKASYYVGFEQYTGQQRLGNIVVGTFPYIIYGVASMLYVKWRSQDKSLLKYESFVMLGMSFLFMQMTVLLFTRFVHFFTVYFIMFFAQAFVDLAKDVKRLKIGVAYVRALIVFFPLFIGISFYYNKKIHWVYPYNSVLNRKIDKAREDSYAKSAETRIPANVNIY